MKKIMKSAVNKVYSLLWQRTNDSSAYLKSVAFGLRYTDRWDDPENSPNDTINKAEGARWEKTSTVPTREHASAEMYSRFGVRKPLTLCNVWPTSGCEITVI